MNNHANQHNFSNNSLSIIHWNANSLKNKISKFKIFLNNFNPDIICINETKCNDTTAAKYLILNNYKMIHRQRYNKNGGGGVCMYIHNRISYERITSIENLELEAICISIQLKVQKLYVVTYYNPPDKILNKKLFEWLNDKVFILCGDLNSKSKILNCTTNNRNSQILEQINQFDNSIFIKNQENTYKSFQDSSQDILDYFVCSTNLLDNFISLNVLKNYQMESDHYPMLVKFGIEYNSKEFSNHELDYKYNFSKANWEKFKNNLPVNTPDEILNCNNVNTIFEYIMNEIKITTDIAVPKQNCKATKKIPRYLLEIIEVKNKIKNKKKKTVDDLKLYNLLKKTIKEEMNAIENQKWEKLTMSLENKIVSSRPFWKKINDKRKKEKKDRGKLFPKLVYNNKCLESEIDKANCFGEILQSTFDNENFQSFDEDFKKEVENYLNAKDFKDDFYQPVTLMELEKELKSLNKYAASGNDEISNLQLLNLNENFKNLLVKLFNLSVETGCIPNAWKVASISMIPKKVKNSPNPKDYRPISLTSCVSKLCEKLVKNRLIKFLQENKLLIVEQSGFRAKRQTKDNIIHLIQKSVESFNRKKKTCAIFFDIASAFDKVWHDGLIFKMSKLKVPNFIINWVKNFLNNRSFFVKINETKTDLFNIKSGVPQGAVLSPILFSIYINDIVNRKYKNKSYSVLFADDLCTYFIYKRPGNIGNIVNKYLKELENWLNRWRLKMTTHKCNYLIIKKGKKLESDKLNLTMYDQKLNECDETTFLGITIDNRLNFETHVESIRKKCYDRINCLKVLSNKKWKLKPHTLVNIYKVLIRSVLDYSSIIISRLSKDKINKLEAIQNTALRIIFKKSQDEPQGNLLKLANLDKIENRFNELNLKYLNNAMLNENELIEEIVDDFVSYNEGKMDKYETFLGNII